MLRRIQFIWILFLCSIGLVSAQEVRVCNDVCEFVFEDFEDTVCIEMECNGMSPPRIEVTVTVNGVQFTDSKLCDQTPPTCSSTLTWTDRPLLMSVDNCTDDMCGCDVDSFEPREFENQNQPGGARACDLAGNCTQCDLPFVDEEPPTCIASFEHPDRWHNADEFGPDAGNLKCWLEVCEDFDPDDEAPENVASGCLPIPDGLDTPIDFADPDGVNPLFTVTEDPLDPVDGDTCMIQVCDNAGNCSTCESPELKYDDTEVLTGEVEDEVVKRADGTPGATCDPDDDDCLCILGDASKCRDDGPINCYTNPFHDRCPGFQNPACLIDPFTPGCPVVNPCYPTQVYDGVLCPRDAVRFCARNPYHYGCNAACENGDIECSPQAPPRQ